MKNITKVLFYSGNSIKALVAEIIKNPTHQKNEGENWAKKYFDYSFFVLSVRFIAPHNLSKLDGKSLKLVLLCPGQLIVGKDLAACPDDSQLQQTPCLQVAPLEKLTLWRCVA